MIETFPLPDLGEGTTEAEIVRWLVREGDLIGVDQPVVEVETVKAVVEVPCPYGGAVIARHGQTGDVLKVGDPLVTVDEGPVGKPELSGPVLVGRGPSADTSLETARRRAARKSRRASTTPTTEAAQAGERTSTSIRQDGVEPAEHSDLVGRNDPQRVTEEPKPERGATAHGQVGERSPLRSAQRAAAARLSKSRHEIPDATVWVDVDATGLMTAQVALRQVVPEIGLLALIARFCVSGLRRFPALNASVDPSGEAIIHHSAINLGFAAQTSRGLLVPVVKDAQRHTTAELALEIARMTDAARTGTLSTSELTGGTFTLNNYGVFGVDGADAIINHPEAAILGVGRIMERPWAVSGTLAVRSVVQLSLSFDHRVCDGGTAAGFLRHVANLIEAPVRLLEES